MLDLVFWILFGGLFGWIASIVLSDTPETATSLYILVGTCGALIGGTLVRIAGFAEFSGFSAVSAVSAILGSFICVTLVRILSLRRGSSH